MDQENQIIEVIGELIEQIEEARKNQLPTTDLFERLEKALAEHMIIVKKRLTD